MKNREIWERTAYFWVVGLSAGYLSRKFDWPGSTPFNWYAVASWMLSCSLGYYPLPFRIFYGR